MTDRKLYFEIAKLAYANPSYRKALNPVLAKYGSVLNKKAWRVPKFYPKPPEGAYMDTPEGTTLRIYRFDYETKPTIMIFSGKSEKPLVYNYFRSPEQAEQHIAKIVKENKASLAYKKQRLLERKQWKHTVQEGDIFVSSWGYDQTNIDYYQVIKVIEKSVFIRKIGKTRHAESAHDFEDRVMPAKDKFIGPPMRKLVGQGNSIKITSYAYAYLWDGKPDYETSPYGGH